MHLTLRVRPHPVQCVQRIPHSPRCDPSGRPRHLHLVHHASVTAAPLPHSKTSTAHHMGRRDTPATTGSGRREHVCRKREPCHTRSRRISATRQPHESHDQRGQVCTAALLAHCNRVLVRAKPTSSRWACYHGQTEPVTYPKKARTTSSNANHKQLLPTTSECMQFLSEHVGEDARGPPLTHVQNMLAEVGITCEEGCVVCGTCMQS